jgi:hypothetical protein
MFTRGNRYKKYKVRRSTKSRPGNGGAAIVRNPATSSMQVYRGPTAMPGAGLQDRRTRVNLYLDFGLTSSGAGVLATVLNFSSSFYEWSSWAGVYEEFRVLSLSVIFLATNKYSKTLTNCRPGYVIIDRTNGTALNSRTSACEHESAIFVNLEDQWHKKVNMSNAAESQFQPTTSITPTFWIKMYFDSLTATTEYGYVKHIALIEFRGRF